MKQYFVTGISTGIGKTICSAVLVEKLQADYWKPIQSGDLDKSDSLTVGSLVSNTLTRIHPERFRLNNPLSPHRSAKIDGIQIQLPDFMLPLTENNLIVEGAGGLMVPLNDRELILDLIKHLDMEVIVVSENYLGSINHTLMTLAVLKDHDIKIKGIVFNGASNEDSESYIENYTGVNVLGHVPLFPSVNKSSIQHATQYITGL